jgi:eukaryotic-like serine/threonine-protein kinase
MPVVYAPGAKVDHYEIIRKLGHGGMNYVYLARDLNNQEEVVLKFPNDDLIGDIAVFERFKREAEIGNRLTHPNIQQLRNNSEERHDNYLVVEYIEGRTLRAVLDDYAPDGLPVELAMGIAIQICEALVYAHEHGVYHRDMKPENIMVREDGTIKIIDFGIALLEGARRVTWRGLSGTVGTPDYMSPEQLRGERGTESADIYGTGVMLYEMLCGHTPFEGENIFAIMNLHVSQDPPSLLDCNQNISPALATVVMHAIRRDPDKRYRHIKDMLEDLCNLQHVKPVPYEPDVPGPSRLRQQIIMGVIITVVICLIVIAVGFLAQFAQHLAR